MTNANIFVSKFHASKMLVLRVFKVLKVLRVLRVLKVLKVLRVQRLNVSRTCGACFIASLFHSLRRVFEVNSKFLIQNS